MTHFCTVCDKNYIHKAVALYHSLADYHPEMVLYWLCMDDETFATAQALAAKLHYKIQPVHLRQLLNNYPALRQAQNNPASQYGTAYSQFCWCLTPFFVNWLLGVVIPENDYLVYVDSDLCFYGNVTGIIAGMGTASVALHSHRHGGRLDQNADNGYYNVGMLVFKNDKVGSNISTHWKQWLLRTDHQYYKTHGTCGDQKYLELFEKLWPGAVYVFDEAPNCSLAHGAPWNFGQYEFTSPPHGVRYNGADQHILFNHFSHFNYDLLNGNWRSAVNDPPEWQPEVNNPPVLNIYANYFERIKKAAQVVDEVIK